MVLISGLVVASCGQSGHDRDPGGLTADEAQALDEAAEMLQAQRLPKGAPETGQAGDPLQPAAQATEARPDA